MANIKSFGETAKGLARNPLGIIALFIVLIYGFASLVVGLSGNLDAKERYPIIWFLVIFPVLVLIAFSWLVSRHYKKLYAPSDYKNEANFLQIVNPELNGFVYAKPGVDEKTSSDITKDSKDLEDDLKIDRSIERKNIYKKSRGVFLAHLLDVSQNTNNEYDVFIYLVRHKNLDFSDIKSAEFYFGSFWGNRIFHGTKIGNKIGVKTSAYGSFLCTCHITFTDNEKVSISRYIDLEMIEALKKALAKR